MAKTPTVGKKAATTPKKSIKGKKAKRVESYSSYIRKVLEQVHPNSSISTESLEMVNSLINDIFQRLASLSSKLCHHCRRFTMTARDIQTAVNILMPGELNKHAVSEGTRAVIKSQ